MVGLSTFYKIIGMSYWLFTMLFLAIAFYYWYYIPERVILPIIMGAIAVIACVYAIYWFAKQKSYFLPMMTAVIFAAIVLYFSNYDFDLKQHKENINSILNRYCSSAGVKRIYNLSYVCKNIKDFQMF